MADTAVEIRGLTHRYGDSVALEVIDLDVARGEVLALVGRNGAGKTTLIRLIASLLDVQAGQLVRNVTSIGYCPQDLVIWPDLTVHEQLSFMRGMYGVEASAVADACRVLGLQDEVDVIAGKLSGGQKRKLSIALSTLHRPAALVLDEPEVGLDPAARLELRSYLASLAADGVAIVLSSHSLDEVERIADRVAVLESGSVVAIGTPAELAGDGRLEDRFL